MTAALDAILVEIVARHAALLQMFRTMRQRRWERDGADGAPI